MHGQQAQEGGSGLLPLNLPQHPSEDRVRAILAEWAPRLTQEAVEQARLERSVQLAVNLFRNLDQVDERFRSFPGSNLDSRRERGQLDHVAFVYDHEPHERFQDLAPGQFVDEMWISRQGRSEKDCTECDPQGMQPCDYCAGQGSVICDAEYPCNACRGTGRVGDGPCPNSGCFRGTITVAGGAREHCSDCHGSGRLWCHSCNGFKAVTFAKSAQVVRNVQTSLFQTTTEPGARSASLEPGEWELLFDGTVGTEPPVDLPAPLSKEVADALSNPQGETSRHLIIWGAALTTVSFRRRGMMRNVTMVGDCTRVIGKQPGVLF